MLINSILCLLSNIKTERGVIMYKRKKSSIIITLSFMIGSLLLSNTVSAASNSLSISKVKQTTNQWCWAASSEMSGKFYYNYKTGNTSSRSQIMAVTHVKGNPPPNEGGSPIETVDAVEYVAYDNSNCDADTVSLGCTYSQVKGFINLNKPIIAGVQGTGFAHMVVIKGYKDAYLLSSDRVVYVDPWTGSEYTTNYSNFYDGPLGNGIWMDTVHWW